MLILILAAILLLAWLGPWRSHSREYWIKAEEILWNYSPSYPIDRMTDEPFGEKELVFLKPGPDRIGRIYRKAVFRSYSPNFGTLLDGPQPYNEVRTSGDGARVRRPSSREEHLGALGPILRAEVGDTIVVHFRNETRFPLSLHPHGVAYDKASEGSGYSGSVYADSGQAGSHQHHGGGSTGNAVQAGGSYTYRWQVPPRSGPGPADPDSIAWPYHSHVNEVGDTSAGLVGAIVIHRRGSLDERRQLPKGVDREFVNLFTVTDENKSLYLESNMREFLGTAPINTEDEEFVESNLMHGINGFVYGDLPGLTMAEGEHVRWHVMSMGSEIDIHTPHWHGATLLENGRRLDTTEIFPASSRTLDMTPDRPGMWMMHCHVNDHMEAGMHAMFTVLPSRTSSSSSG